MKSAFFSRLPAILVIGLTIFPLAALAEGIDAPGAGKYTVTLHEHTWGRGGSYSPGDLPANSALYVPSLDGYDWDGENDVEDDVSSYSVCNNTGVARNYRIQLFKDPSFRTLFTDKIIPVASGTCVTENVTANDVLSSLIVSPQ